MDVGLLVGVLIGLALTVYAVLMLWLGFRPYIHAWHAARNTIRDTGRHLVTEVEDWLRERTR